MSTVEILTAIITEKVLKFSRLFCQDQDQDQVYHLRTKTRTKTIFTA